MLSPAPSTLDPHCAAHAQFRQDCPICIQALANALPYPVKKTVEPSRSFGFTDDITVETFRTPRRQPTWLDPDRALYDANSSFSQDPGDTLDTGISRIVVRFLLKLIWPF